MTKQKVFTVEVSYFHDIDKVQPYDIVASDETQAISIARQWHTQESQKWPGRDADIIYHCDVKYKGIVIVGETP